MDMSAVLQSNSLLRCNGLLSDCIRVEKDVIGQRLIPGLTVVPALWMGSFGGLIGLVPFGEDLLSLPTVTLRRGEELNPAVMVPIAVPMNKVSAPGPGKALGLVVGTVFQGFEEGYSISIVIADPETAVGGVMPGRYSVSSMVAPFMRLPLSECSTRG